MNWSLFITPVTFSELNKPPAALPPSWILTLRFPAESYETALLAAGGVLQCMDSLCSGRASKSFRLRASPRASRGPRKRKGVLPLQQCSPGGRICQDKRTSLSALPLSTSMFITEMGLSPASTASRTMSFIFQRTNFRSIRVAATSTKSAMARKRFHAEFSSSGRNRGFQFRTDLFQNRSCRPRPVSTAAHPGLGRIGWLLQ